MKFSQQLLRTNKQKIVSKIVFFSLVPYIVILTLQFDTPVLFTRICKKKYRFIMLRRIVILRNDRFYKRPCNIPSDRHHKLLLMVNRTLAFIVLAYL